MGLMASGESRRCWPWAWHVLEVAWTFPPRRVMAWRRSCITLP